MKTRLRLIAVLALACSAIAAGSPATASPAISASFVDPDAPENAEIRAIGERAINRIGVTLINEVSVAVAKNGAEKAIDICHLKALPLTEEIIAGMPRITAVKRTSLRLRNPINAPDDAEKLALNKVQEDLASGILTEVQSKLSGLYPADQATGYAAGQWRGFIRVSVSDTPAPHPKPAPTKAGAASKKS
ncbi:MAG: hypothetical protein EXS37_00320 [Opitutus sp.]|nr:hypothetical protein [Opitutus sp.]